MIDPDNLVPLPAALTSLNWRSVQGTDIPAIQEMLQANQETDQVETTATEERLQQILGMLGEQLGQSSRIAMAKDGRVAAIAFVLLLPDEDEPLALINGNVHTAFRGQGIGSYLLEWMEARIRQAFVGQGAGKSPIMRTSCLARQADRVQLFENHGFGAERFSYQMRRSLADPILEAELPAGLSWQQWSPELDPQLMSAFNEAFHGHWGLPVMNPETWHQFFIGVPQFRGDLTLLAMDGNTIAGFCVNWVEGQEGWIEAIGVVPAWRGRGLASALMAKSLNLFQAENLERAGLDVDTQNPSGALRLYQKHGFDVAREEIHFVKHLS
jgi:mycothiol synthase